MNWEIVQQEQTVKKETVLVDVKHVRFRPTSEVEREQGKPDFVGIGIQTHTLTFKHIANEGIFKVVRQVRKRPKVENGEQVKDEKGKAIYVSTVVFGLHEPVQTKVREKVVRRKTVVTIPDPEGRTTIVKEKSKTVPEDLFFSTVFPQRIRDEEFRALVQQKFAEVPPTMPLPVKIAA